MPAVQETIDQVRQIDVDQYKYGFETEEIRDCGEHVLVVVRENARGKASGAVVDARIYQVMTFREGRVLRYQEFYDETQALEAVGLRE